MSEGVAGGQIDESLAKLGSSLQSEIGKVLVGQEAMVQGLLVGLLSSGHILIEGLPGLAKTLTVHSLARAIHTDFSRIQFTPDMLPADVIGTQIFNPKDATFSVKQGPIFFCLSSVTLPSIQESPMIPSPSA